MEGLGVEYIKDHASFIVVLLLIVGGFGFLAVHGSGSSNASSTTQAAATKPSPTANMQSPMSKGSKNAKISLIQYSDFLCPSCSYFTTQIMPTIEKEYVDTGKMNFEFRPMAFIAEGSTISDEGAYCAIDQGKFWQYHDGIYNYVWNSAFSKGVDPKTTTILTTPIVESAASALGLDKTSFNTCLESGKYASRVASATDAANKVGITSTPTIIVNGKQLGSNISLQSVEALIKSQL